MAGSAVLCRDESTGQPYWSTHNGDGEDHCKLSLRQPVVFPTTKFPIATVVRIYLPKGNEDEKK